MRIAIFKRFFGRLFLICGPALFLFLAPRALAIGPPPSYSASPTFGPAPLSVRFTGPSLDANSNAITSWRWNFGDGIGTNNSQSPLYTYTNAGAFTPTLTISNSVDGSSPVSGPSITVAISWTNLSGGNWSVAANWFPSQVPNATNAALITNAGTYAVNINVNAAVTSLSLGGAPAGSQLLQTSGFSLTASNAFINANGVCALTNGTFNGAMLVGGGAAFRINNMDVNAEVEVADGGAMILSGTATCNFGEGGDSNDTNYWLALDSGGELIDSGADLDLYCAMTNSGTFNLTAASLGIFNNGSPGYFGGAYNQSNGVINLATNADIQATYTSAFLSNEGTINVAEGISSIELGVAAFTGDYTAAPGTTAEFTGGSSSPTIAGTGPTLSGGGIFEFTSGLLELTTNRIPNLLLTGGTVGLGPGFQGGAITNLELDGSALTNLLPVTGTLAATNSTFYGAYQVADGGLLFMDGVTLDAQVTVENGGEILGLGSASDLGQAGEPGDTNDWLWVQSGGNLNLSTGLGLYAVLTNSGAVNLTNTILYIYNDGAPGYNGGVYNLPGGVINLWDNSEIYGYYGDDYLVNQGTINVLSGASTIDLGLASLAGNYNAVPGTTVSFSSDSSSPTVPGLGLTLGGGGLFEFDSGVFELVSNTIPNLALVGGTVELGSNFQGGTITNLALDGSALSNSLPVTGALLANGSVLYGVLTVANGGVLSLDNATLDAQVTVENGGQILGLGSASDLGQTGEPGDTNDWLWVQSGGTVNLSTGLRLYAVLTNSGAVNLTNTILYIYNDGAPGYNGGVYNLPGGVINLWDNSEIDGYYGDDYLVNQGTISVLSGASEIDLGLASLAGNYNAVPGTTVSFSSDSSSPTVPGLGLTLGGGGLFEFYSGVFELVSNTIPNLALVGGTVELGSNFQGGTITNLALDGSTFSNTLPLTGTMSATNGTILGVLVISNGATFAIDGVTLDAQVTVENGGQILGLGSASGLGQTGEPGDTNDWLWVQSGGTVNLSTGLGLYAVLTNSGAVNLTNTILYIYNDGAPGYNGGVYNLPGGVINLWDNSEIYGYYGSDYLVNNGAISLSSGTGVGVISIDNLNNVGTISTQPGTTTLQVGSFNSPGSLSGTFNAAAGSTIEFLAGTSPGTSAGAGLSLPGAGQFELYQGLLTLVSNAIPNLTCVGGTVALGTNFQGGAITNLSLDGSALSNSLPVTGALLANGSVLYGVLTVANGGVLSLDNATLDAQMTVQSGGRVVSVGNPSDLGEYDFANNANYWISVQSGGTFNVSNGFALYALMTNSGMVNITNGYLDIDNNGTAELQGGFINESNGVVNLQGGGSFSGAFGFDFLVNQGTINSYSGSVSCQIEMDNFTNAATLSSQTSSLVLSGTNLTLLPSGTLSVSIGGTSPLQYGALVFNNGSNVDLSDAGALLVTLTNGFVPSPSDSFQILRYPSFSGNFTATNLPAGATWQSVYGGTALNLDVGGVTPPPTVQFTANPTNGEAPLTVQFAAPGLDTASNLLVAWLWHFGDGTTSTAQSPSHTYTNAGVYTPTLIVTNVSLLAIAATGPGITVLGSVTLTVVASPTIAGSVFGGQTAVTGTQVTATASTNPGYAFINWTTTNGVVQSTSNPYTFNLNSTETLVGNFSPYYNLHVQATSGGSVIASASSGSGTNLTLVSNTTVTATATAANGYGFSNWSVSGTVVSSSPSYIFPLLANETLTANFTPAYTLTVAGSPTNGGSVTGGGVYAAGSLVTAGAIPSGGYTFSNWTSNGVAVSVSSNYSFAIDTNVSLVANFASAPAQFEVFHQTNLLTNGQIVPINFGSVAQNQPGPTLAFLVTNTGGGALDIYGVSIPTGFSIVSNLPSVINSGASASLEVQLETTQPGNFSGNIVISNNNPSNGLFSFPVTGAIGRQPVIVIAPTNQTVTAGSSTAFSATATGAGPLSYQWLFYAANAPTNPPISLAQSSALSLNNVLSANAGTYEIIVSNASGTTNASAALTVSPASPTVTWSTPAPIVYGAKLGSNQLNATASVAGSFSYSPVPGTLLNAGTSVLTVVFTPADTADFSPVTTNVSLVVSPAPLTVTASNVVRLVGAANPVFGGVIAGTNFSDGISATFTCNATIGSPAGTYPITPALADPNHRLGNYTVTINIGTLTVSAGVILTSPNNGEEFAAPASIPFSATATLPAGVQSFALYTNSVLVMSNHGVTSLSTVLNNVPGGSYQFTAVAVDNNNQSFVQSAFVTVNAPGATLIDFDPLDTSIGVMNGLPLSSYLAGFGVSISNATFGTSLEAATAQEANSQSGFIGAGLPEPSSSPNLFTQVGSTQPITFSLDFAHALQSFGFTRVGIATNGPSAISHPAWTATILDASGNALESVSEPLLLSASNIPARTFSLVGANIASVRFNSDSHGTAAFDAVLLDDLLLSTNATASPLTISLAQPGGPFTAPARIPLTVTVNDSYGPNYSVAFYSGPTLVGVVSNSTTFTWNNVLNGTYSLTAQVVDASGYAKSSASVSVSVAPGGNATAINFDSLNADTGPVINPLLSNYLAIPYGIEVSSNSANTEVAVENQNNVAGGGFVIASSQPNLLTQLGSSGPVSFTVEFSNLLGVFSFTRPELVANPYVTHPAWQVEAFDALGRPLASISSPQISSATNVPAQTYSLTNPASGGGIASVAFNSEGSGFTTFNALLLDDFVLAKGSNLPPAVVIAIPTNGQVFTSLAAIPITALAAPSDGSVTSVSFYANGTLISNSSPPFSIDWNAPNNGAYSLTAVAENNSGLSSTSAPVVISIATSGIAIVAPPTNTTVGVSNSAAFSVAVNTTNVTYQWLVNGGAIPGATLSNYTLVHAQFTSAGTYSVVVTGNGQSITSPPAVLTVLGPPVISSPAAPTNVTVMLGSNITLTAVASESQSIAFYYQWQRNGQFLDGATNAEFTINNAQPSDSGNYQVLVANAVASAESPVFTVSVNFLGTNAPNTTNDVFANSLAIHPTNGPIGGDNSGSPAIGELSEIDGKPAGRFLWFNWTASFTGLISFSTLGSDFDTLLGIYTGTNVSDLTAIAEDDDSAGYFDSLVSFNCTEGTTYQIAVAGYRGAFGDVVLSSPSYLKLDSNYLTVALPLITEQPVNQIVQAGQTVTLSAGVTNATSYQWYFAGAPVAGGNGTSLVITNFPVTAAGDYYLKAANSIGSAQSDMAAVQIQDAAQTTGSPTNLLTDKFGDAVDLTGGISTTRFHPEDSGGETGGFTLSQNFSTIGATKEEGEPDHAGQPGGASYWYSYTAFSNGAVQFSTAGSTFNTILAVYSGPGTSFSTLVSQGAGYTTNYAKNGQPSVTVTNRIGRTTYYVAVDGYQGASGAAHLGIVFTPNTNATPTLESGPVTNKTMRVEIVSPANHFLTTSSNVTVEGTVTGQARAQQALLTSVQLTVNGGDAGAAAVRAPTYVPVTVTEPSGAVGEEAKEVVTWSATVALVPGANVIVAQGIGSDAVSLPSRRTVFLVSSLPQAQEKSILTLRALPAGKGKVIGLTDQAELILNKVYSVKAAPVGNQIFVNWTSGTSSNSLAVLSSSASLSFIMTSNLILQANFMTNPFPAVAGVYSGLFSPVGGVTVDSSGFFTASLPADGQGSYSARLLLQGESYPVSGSFDLSGGAEIVVDRAGLTPLVVELHVNLSPSDNQITGAIADSEDGGWTSTLQAYRANPTTNFAGKYTLIFQPSGASNEPPGFGYATLTANRAGRVELTGRLADNAAVSQSVLISSNGDIPLYAPLYSRGGLILGWLNLSPAQSVQGSGLAWIKPAAFANLNVGALGSFYSPPRRGANNFDLTNGVLTVGSAGWDSPLSYTNVTVSGNTLTGTAPMKGAINSSTGVLTLTFRPPGADADITAQGVVLQDTNSNSTNAAGWFLSGDQSGYFILEQ